MARHYTDETGNRYGRLTVVKYAFSNNGAYFSCKCDCGNTLDIIGTALRRGNTTSCGCRQKEVASRWASLGIRKGLSNQVRVGDRYGKLLIVDTVQKTSKNQNLRFVCRCDCGNTIKVRDTYLRDGSKTSCNCVAKDEKLNRRDYLKKLISDLRIKGYSFQSISDLLNQTQTPCISGNKVNWHPSLVCKYSN